jgi:hypothetical protein
MQQAVLLARQCNVSSIERHRPRHEINCERSGPHHRVLVNGLVTAAQRRFAACGQFGNAERLDDTVVCASLGFAERIAQLGSFAVPTSGALHLSRNAFITVTSTVASVRYKLGPCAEASCDESRVGPICIF